MATQTLVDTTSSQTLTNKTLTSPTITSGTISLAAAPTNTLDAATKGYVDGLNTVPLLNGSLAASVSSNILTLTLNTAGGSTPSASNPVRVTFRSATSGDGSLVTRTVTSSTTMTFASGSTLGMTNGQAARIWVGLLDNAGTVELCAWNPYNSSSQNSLRGFIPNTYVTTTAEGSGTATSAQTLYSTNARTTVPFILLGFIEISEATAGVWATAPTVGMTYRDGMRKTGDTVQSQYVQTGAVATGGTVVPDDDTIPQNTEGDQFMSQAITPTSAVNILHILAIGCYSNTGSNNEIQSIFQDSTANALATTEQTIPATQLAVIPTQHRMLAGTTSSTTFKVRAGGQGNTTTFNGAAAARKMGGVMSSSLTVTEIYT